MDFRYTINPIKKRQYRAAHKKSKRIFDLIRLSPTSSAWVCYEIIKDKRDKFQYEISDKSRKDLLDRIHIKINTKPKKKVRKRISRTTVSRTRRKFRPYKYIPFKMVKISARKFKCTTSDEKFFIQHLGEGWKCISTTEAQPICIGMASREEAVLELQFYLDPGPRTKENWDEYFQLCFKDIT